MSAITGIELCGPLAVELSGRRIEDRLLGRQGGLVVAYLAVNRRRAVPREELIATLWPSASPGERDEALSALLTKIRRSLGRGSLEGRRELRLVLAPDARIDWEVLAERIAGAEAATARNDWHDALQDAGAALELAQRGFLTGHTGAWVKARRRELEERRQRALEALTAASRALGGTEPSGPERAARSTAKAAPFRDSVAPATPVAEDGHPERLREGEAALKDAQWDAAHQAFEAALAMRETAAAHNGVGQALWFLGRIEEAIAAREHAFERYLTEGNCDRAARAAVWVSHQYTLSGRSSAARGWLARAERALEGVARGSGHGWVAVERARHARDVEECIQHAEYAMAIARETDAADLEVFALSVLGRAQVAAGRRADGMRLLEEAMAAASIGRVHNVQTLGEAYCNLITACVSAGEWERATEWCGLVEDFARTNDATPLFGACRTIHADVLVAKGRWPEAERALESALAAHARHYVPQLGAATAAAMAELRVRQGRLAEAEQLLAGREEHPLSLRALSQLRMAEGRPAVAVALLERGLAATKGDAMRATELLAPLADARLACGHLEGAQAAATQLVELARSSGSRLVGARADLATARVALAAGREAAEPARRALAEFSRLAMPLDTGEARLALARALAADAPDLARDEASTAFAVFQELGAARAMDGAAAVLRELGAGTPGRPRANGELTAREREVLGLLAKGMSNARIAQALFISEKTAGHHVSHILAKLGVANRAEAAAHAARAESALPAR